jgi:hypothetical protein
MDLRFVGTQHPDHPLSFFAKHPDNTNEKAGQNTREEVLSMLNLMSAMASSVRHRVAPRRRSGMGTMTALFVGASVGIAAWEAMRKSQLGGKLGGMSPASKMSASGIAEEVMQEIED